MSRIVVYAHRYKRPPPKKKLRAVESAAAVVVHAPKPQAAEERARKRPVAKPKSTALPSRPPLPTIVVATNQKRLKRLRAELRMAEPREPSSEVEAFFARNVRPGGRCRPRARLDATSPERQTFAGLHGTAAGSPAWSHLHRPQERTTDSSGNALSIYGLHYIIAYSLFGPNFASVGTVTAAPVPEPASVALITTALVGENEKQTRGGLTC
jgi:hypothetical protein